MRKYAIITGGSRGIGRAICEKLAQDTDYHLLIAYQSNEVAALETLNHIKKLGREGETYLTTKVLPKPLPNGNTTIKMLSWK